MAYESTKRSEGSLHRRLLRVRADPCANALGRYSCHSIASEPPASSCRMLADQSHHHCTNFLLLFSTGGVVARYPNAYSRRGHEKLDLDICSTKPDMVAFSARLSDLCLGRWLNGDDRLKITLAFTRDRTIPIQKTSKTSANPTGTRNCQWRTSQSTIA